MTLAAHRSNPRPARIPSRRAHPVGRRRLRARIAAALLPAVLGAGPALAAEIPLALQCDDSGAFALASRIMCRGARDYLAWHEAQRNLPGGHVLRLHELAFPPGPDPDAGPADAAAQEAVAALEAAGPVSAIVLGGPATAPLLEALEAAGIPFTHPGLAGREWADGERHPLAFATAATPAAQVQAALHHLRQQGRTPRRLAFLYTAGAAGGEALAALRGQAASEGFRLKGYAVPAGAGPKALHRRVLAITRTFDADRVVLHLVGASAARALEAFHRVGYPMDRITGLAWSAAETHLNRVGWTAAEGFTGLQVAGVGPDAPVLRAIRDQYRDRGDPPPVEMEATAYYNRGVLAAALHAHAVRAALRARGMPVARDTLRQAFARAGRPELEGIVPPLVYTSRDHQGGGWVAAYQVRDRGWQRIGDWFRVPAAR